MLSFQVVDAVMAVKTTDERGQVRYPIRVSGIISSSMWWTVKLDSINASRGDIVAPISSKDSILSCHSTLSSYHDLSGECG